MQIIQHTCCAWCTDKYFISNCFALQYVVCSIYIMVDLLSFIYLFVPSYSICMVKFYMIAKGYSTIQFMYCHKFTCFQLEKV